MAPGLLASIRVESMKNGKLPMSFVISISKLIETETAEEVGDTYSCSLFMGQVPIGPL